MLWASMSTNNTLFPIEARIEPTLAVVVVLPTPPLWLANEMIFACFVISVNLCLYVRLYVLSYCCIYLCLYSCIYSYTTANISIMFCITKLFSIIISQNRILFVSRIDTVDFYIAIALEIRAVQSDSQSTLLMFTSTALPIYFFSSACVPTRI